LFCAVFTLELILRLCGDGSRFLYHMGIRTMNIFDAVLVAISLIQLAFENASSDVQAPNTSIGKVMRLFRMARIMRIARLARFFVELRVMVVMILLSLRSLFWLGVLLSAMMYLLAICFTQGFSDYWYNPSFKSKNPVVQRHYGSLSRSIYSLFKSMSGGQSWGELSDALMEVDAIMPILFLMYIFFTIFSVLNIVTGVFVEGAIENAKQERDMAVERGRKEREAYCVQVRRLLEEIDQDNSGTITMKELEMCLQSETMKAYFAALDISIGETQQLFALLDQDQSGTVEVDEFVEGCFKLKGEAKSIDIHMLLLDNRSITRRILELTALTEQQASEIIKRTEKAMNSEPHIKYKEHNQRLLPDWKACAKQECLEPPPEPPGDLLPDHVGLFLQSDVSVIST